MYLMLVSSVKGVRILCQHYFEHNAGIIWIPAPNAHVQFSRDV